MSTAFKCKRVTSGTYVVVDAEGTTLAEITKSEGVDLWAWSLVPGVGSPKHRGYGVAVTKRQALETIRNIEPVIGLGNRHLKCNKPLTNCERLAVVFDANDEQDVHVKRYCSEHAEDHEYLVRKLRKGSRPNFPEANWTVIPDNWRTA